MYKKGSNHGFPQGGARWEDTEFARSPEVPIRLLDSSMLNVRPMSKEIFGVNLAPATLW